MPDFLQSLIRRAHDLRPALQPRTSSLFEPTASGYGPGGRFQPAPNRTASELANLSSVELVPGRGLWPAPNRQDPDAEEHPTGRGSREARPEQRKFGSQAENQQAPGSETPHDSAGIGAANASLARPVRDRRLKADQNGLNQAAPEAGRGLPTTPRGLIERLRALEAWTAEYQSASSAPSAMVGQPSTAGQNQLGASIEGQIVRSTSAVPASQGGDPNNALAPSQNPYSNSLTAPQEPSQPDRLARLSSELANLRQLQADLWTNARPIGSSAANATRPTERFEPPSGRPRQTASPLQIQVTIGRVEVRAGLSPTPPPSQAGSRPGASPRSLEEYLRRRNGDAA